MTRYAPAAWLAAACLSLLPAIVAFLPPRGAKFGVPETPLDMIAPKQAAQWKFLRQAWVEMPRSVVYTVRAPDLHDEMSIYMMSLGMFFESQPRASSYFGFPRAGGGAEARVILSLPCMDPAPAGFDCKRVGDGCLCSRSAS